LLWKEENVLKRDLQGEIAEDRLKTTAGFPANLYSRAGILIAPERGAGGRLRAQNGMAEELHAFLEIGKKDAAA
jgi:hypothetical protein